MPLILSGNTGTSTLDSSTGLTFSDSSLQGAAASPFGLKNRIINGDMVISQRNGTSSVTPTEAQYTLDRWQSRLSAASKYTVQQNAGSVTPPAGFTNYLGVTSSSAYSVSAGDYFAQQHNIEGYNIADLAWGTANAKTITLSFWVRSSLTGTFGGCAQNGSANRSYPFTYTISSANTWEQKSLTIAGDTSGTWNTTNGAGLVVFFGLGVGSTYSGTSGSWAGANYVTATGATSVVGTNGATFYITGVQLERNTTATPFEWIPYTTELQLCQRYFEKSYSIATAVGSNTSEGVCRIQGSSDGSNNLLGMIYFNTSKRTAATMTFYRETGASGSWDAARNGANSTPSPIQWNPGVQGTGVYAGIGAAWTNSFMYGHWIASAEL